VYIPLNIYRSEKCFGKNLEEENDLEDQGADRILKWFFGKQHGVA